MTTLASRGTTGTGGATATWATTANAVDGAVGTTPATYATWTNASRSVTGQLDITGYDFSAIPAGSTINSVTATFRHIESSTTVLSAVTIQGTSASALVGTQAAATRNTVAHTDTPTLGTITLAQLQASFGIRLIATRSNSTTSTVWSIDYVDVAVDYTAPPTVVSTSDSGTGTESGSLAIGQTETSIGDETAGTGTIATDPSAGGETAGVATSAADNASGLEDVKIGQSQGDTAAGAESTEIGVSVADSGSGAESVDVRLGAADIAAGSEAGAVNQLTTDIDTATGNDAQTIAAVSTALDAGAGSDAPAGNALTGVDAGAGDESVVAAATSQADAGTGSDVVQIISLSTADTAVGLESGAASPVGSDVTVTFELWENGTFIAAIGTALVSTTAGVVSVCWENDVAALADVYGEGVELRITAPAGFEVGAIEWNATVLVPTGIQSKSGSDTGIGLQMESLAAELASDDAAAGVDITAVTATVSASDGAVGLETQLLVVTLPASDAGVGSDSGTYIAHVVALDTATGTETAYVLIAHSTVRFSVDRPFTLWMIDGPVIDWEALIAQVDGLTGGMTTSWTVEGPLTEEQVAMHLEGQATGLTNEYVLAGPYTDSITDMEIGGVGPLARPSWTVEPPTTPTTVDPPRD